MTKQYGRRYSTAINFSVDLAGKPDERNSTWGWADFVRQRLTFSPVEDGGRTLITRVRGDFIGYPKQGVIPGGTSAEIGWGLKSTAADSPSRVAFTDVPNAWPYDNSFAWVQGAVVDGAPFCRCSFDYDDLAFLLEADGIMISQTFVAINTTQMVIHMEPTFVVDYEYIAPADVPQFLA